MTILIAIASACVVGLIVSAVIAWASNRSPVFNMIFGAGVAILILAGALIAAALLTRRAFP
jgi:hypothetical protein